MNDFAWALKELKAGKKIARSIWKKQDLHLQFSKDKKSIELTSSTGAIPWFPAQDDVLSEDWVEV